MENAEIDAKTVDFESTPKDVNHWLSLLIILPLIKQKTATRDGLLLIQLFVLFGCFRY